MTTLTAPRPASKARRSAGAKPAPDTCSLTLSIRGVAYRLSKIRPQDPDVSAAYRLRKAGGEFYIVHRDRHGCHCTCASHVFKHEGIDATGCKHLRALRAWNLI